MIAVIGSVALNYRLEDINRTPRDFDIICSYDDLIGWANPKLYDSFYPINGGKKIVAKSRFGIIECELTYEGSVAEELLRIIESDKNTKIEYHNGKEFIYPSLDILLMIKLSHKFLRNSPAFLKTMMDIRLMESKGAQFPEEYRSWFDRRVKETYYYDHPDLTVQKKDFFKETESFYKYDHDDIHEAIKLGERPAYQYFIEDGEQVKCSKFKFFERCSFEVQLNSVLEESYVLALERSQIPNDFKVPPRKSFEIALEKVCTSITSGWWRDFAYENYFNALELYSDDYVSKFKDALYNERIRPFKEGLYA